MKKAVSGGKFEIPEEVSRVTRKLKENDFEAYLIGGCVRDLFLGNKPKDWDVTTDATPEQIIALFEKTFYENSFGTVGVVNGHEEDRERENAPIIDETLRVIEVTPYRTESAYSDKRRPDSVSFSKNLEDDLKRRDFTINAIAYDAEGEKTVDLYGGLSDLSAGVIRAVGNPRERFAEDALRTLRAVRLSAQLGFEIEAGADGKSGTKQAIADEAHGLAQISKERIRDEFVKMIETEKPAEALTLCHELGLLQYIVPELEKGRGVDQNQAHSFDVWTHLLKSLAHAAKKEMPLHVRLAALFHDIGKPDTRRWAPDRKDYTFYGHEVVGARITEKIMKDLRFPKEITELVVKLVRWHMFFADTAQITHSAVRRMVANVGKEHVWALMDVRACDRIGTGRPKESPYRLRKYHSMLEEVMRDPISVGMLKIDGKRVMEVIKEAPGPRVGYILHALLEEVLEAPERNTAEFLEGKAVELAKLSDAELRAMGAEGKEKKDAEEEKVLKEIRKKHWVE
jgi:poly(A) polymerase/tRNA nucleotidyltransferase (CCA-adding enzyme)